MTAVQDPPSANGTGDTAAVAGAIAKTTQQLTAAGLDPAKLRAAIKHFEAAKLETNDEVVESEDFIDAIYTAIASRTHVYVAGEGGVGKTFGAEVMSTHFGIESVYLQFRADTKREEVFGPLSMTGLQKDLYLHVTKGYLPEAQLAILDEIKDAGRFNRQLLNALNERWMVNGGVRLDMPLDTAVGATNFWMDEQELAALFDRFAQRLVQEEIKTSEGFKKVMRGQLARRRAKALGQSTAKTLTVITADELRMIQHAVDVCDVHEDIIETVDKLWQDAKGEGMRPSPRRYGEGFKLAQAVAVLAGRDFVTEADLRIFSRVLPNHPDEFKAARQLTNGFRDKLTEAIENANASLNEVVDLLAPERERVGKGEDPDTGKIMEARTHFKTLRKMIAQAKDANQGRDHQALDKVLEGLTHEEDFIKKAVLGL